MLIGGWWAGRQQSGGNWYHDRWWNDVISSIISLLYQLITRNHQLLVSSPRIPVPAIHFDTLQITQFLISYPTASVELEFSLKSFVCSPSGRQKQRNIRNVITKRFISNFHIHYTHAQPIHLIHTWSESLLCTHISSFPNTTCTPSEQARPEHQPSREIETPQAQFQINIISHISSLHII